MHEDIWAGVRFKIRNAEYFLDQMSKALIPTEGPPAVFAALHVGSNVDHQWQQKFFANLDAFLAMARSAPEIIRCCFGYDDSKPMKDWWNALCADEQRRRKEFSAEFKTAFEAYKEHPLSQARNISFHRQGYPNAEVAVVGRFNVLPLTGTPVNPASMFEVPVIGMLGDDAEKFAGILAPQPHQISWPDFKIDDNPLFEECRVYLRSATELVKTAEVISVQVHGASQLTSPPS